MLDVHRSGMPMDAAIASLRDIPARVIPYAAATALTRTVKFAQQDVVAAMRTGFDRPTPYTLGATRIEVATKDKLSARIAVKDSGTSGTAPEHYLLPEVEGGPRREKRFELAMRASGFMKPGERAMPGAAAPRDTYGNVAASVIRRVLGQASANRAARIFVGIVGRKGTRGVWQRDGRRVRPLFVFTTRLPQYSRLLDFTGVAQAAAERYFPDEFARAATAITARNA